MMSFDPVGGSHAKLTLSDVTSEALKFPGFSGTTANY